jgi:sugar (pentulose or hexulose) kinase
LGDAHRLLLSGGLTTAELVRAMLADVFAIDAVRPHQEEASAFGAALLAAQSCGLVPDAVAAARNAGYDDPLHPDPATAGAYRAAYARYRDGVTAARSG